MRVDGTILLLPILQLLSFLKSKSVLARLQHYKGTYMIAECVA